MIVVTKYDKGQLKLQWHLYELERLSPGGNEHL